MIGACVSLTVTMKLQLAVPHSLDAVQLTVLVPTVNVCGDVMTVAPILHSTVGVGVPLAVTSKATLLEHRPGAAGTVMSSGQLTDGLLFDVNDALHELLQPFPSVIVTKYVPATPTVMHSVLVAKPPGPVHA